jgi:hypothetical protein
VANREPVLAGNCDDFVVFRAEDYGLFDVGFCWPSAVLARWKSAIAAASSGRNWHTMTGLDERRAGNDEWHAHRRLVQQHAVFLFAMLHEAFAMIADDDYERIFGEPTAFEKFCESAELQVLGCDSTHHKVAEQIDRQITLRARRIRDGHHTGAPNKKMAARSALAANRVRRP